LLLFVLLGFPVAGQTDRQIEDVQLQHLKNWGYVSVSWNPGWKAVSVADASRLEDQLASNPEDVAARIRLLNYYWHNGLRQQRGLSVFWLIEHHPQSPILGLDIAWLFPGDRDPGEHYLAMHGAADFTRARQLWESVIPQHSNVREVLHNAARFFEGADPAKGDDLARRLQAADLRDTERWLSTTSSR
jgi:hypothetical protein